MRFVPMVSRLAAAAAAIGILGASVSGCGTGGHNPAPPPAAKAVWTVLVYMNAANNLQPDSILNIQQMLKVGSDANMNIIVQWKQAACSDCGTTATRTFVGTRRYRVPFDSTGTAANIESGRLTDPSTNIIGTSDMGNYLTLKDFVEWGVRNYPANHTALVIWDHGSGWLPTRASNRLKPVTRAVSQDDDTNHEIETWQMAPALVNVAPLDMVILDASLQQMLEVAYELRSSAKYMVGSEDSPPGTGYPYDQWLGVLKANSQTYTPLQVGQTIVSTFTAAYPTQTNVTQSVLDLTKMPATATALNAFARSLLNHLPDQAAVIQSARLGAQSYSSPYTDNKDLYHYAGLIAAGTNAADLQTAAQNLQAALKGTNGAILVSAHGTTNQDNSNGLAIYIPNATTFSAFGGVYGNLALSAATQWPTFLGNQLE